jgi:hypothetical protein
MKQYYALRIIAFVTKLVGWLIIALGVIACALAALGVHLSIAPYFGSSLIVIAAIAISSLLLGLIFVASGQLLGAVADIATNCARIDLNTARTVQFFDRMSANANRPEPAGTGHPYAR